jgi:hypothetical protein
MTVKLQGEVEPYFQDAGAETNGGDGDEISENDA